LFALILAFGVFRTLQVPIASKLGLISLRKKHIEVNLGNVFVPNFQAIDSDIGRKPFYSISIVCTVTIHSSSDLLWKNN